MDKYTIVSLIGEGSFGRVYKANRKADSYTVAIKIISKRGKSTKELGNLRRECDIQANLEHVNIIKMLESFETKSEMFVVTEFALTDLHRFLLKNGPIKEQNARDLTANLVSALYYLHSHRILHRDLKPQNVLLDNELHAKLCDFGLARNMTMGTHVLTSIKGTPLYMAPELLEEKPYDHQADLWSLGCIIYETLSGHPPFCTSSILHLVSLIRHEDVKWPSFLSANCISFLQGLLEKDAQLRMTWAQILYHPFVEGRLIIANDRIVSSPFINPKAIVETDKLAKKIVSGIKNLTFVTSEDNATCSKDSVNAVLQSDIENIETDVEEPIEIPFVDNGYLPDKIVTNESNKTQELPFHISGNSNLLVNYFNDNFVSNSAAQKDGTKSFLNLKKTSVPSPSDKIKIERSKDLEKRKLSQNLNNFSLRLGQTVETEQIKKISENITDTQKQLRGSLDEDNPSTENSPPCLLPGWDSCDESQSPPIENEEWLAFLHRSMQEILDGELDSLKQQNLVSIIVAPLRNTKASAKVIECVAQLLSLPLILGGPTAILECIKSVYVEVKLVPNLVYSSKLIMSNKDKGSTESDSSVTTQNCKSLNELSSEKIKTISSIYELVCFLVHLNERFLFQFCDAIAILAAHELLITFLSHDFTNPLAARITNCILALLCCVLREVPENAKLVERIIFHPKLDLVLLIKIKNTLLRMRICMLFRLLGRFSCRGLQSIWNYNIRQNLEALMYDSSEQVRTEAESVLGELKQFSFYN